MPEPEGSLRYASTPGRWVLVATIIGSGVASLDATVVNVALPTIGKHFGAGVSGLQWVITGYLISLSALILLGGRLGDLFGRKRVFLAGVVWFTVASFLSGAALNLPMLIASRALQGVGGALLVPGSLAIIESSFVPEDRGRAIGAWAGLGGIATAIGPFVGGWLVSAVSWRLIFFLNVPLSVGVLLASRHVPESTDPTADRHVDLLGAGLVIVGLAGVTFALIEAPSPGELAVVWIIGVVGVLGLVGFVATERHIRHPMLPPSIFGSRQFTAANLVTFVVYAALSGLLFLLAVDLQGALRFSPAAAGGALFPVTVIMLLLSSRAGDLSQRIGPRIPMTVGPLVVGAGLLLMVRISPGGHYVTDVLPAVIVFGLGLSLTVAPLTATVLAAADVNLAGIASGVNNAVARAAGLLAVAVLPALAGITGASYTHPAALSAGFHTAVYISAAVTFSGAVIAFFGIRNPAPAMGAVGAEAAGAGAEAVGVGAEAGSGVSGVGPGSVTPAVGTEMCCPVDGPPLRRPRVG
ncbi:MAG: MFS transporter [Acidimicrobiales bacterium]